jgi:pheromone shutdown protein TraB
VVIEAGVVAGYVIAWAMRKARRAVGRLDDDADAMIDASLDRLHEVVMARLAAHPVLTELGACIPR